MIFEENWQPTIGDKYRVLNFGGMIFVWEKEERVTEFKASYEFCGSEAALFEKVMQDVGLIKSSAFATEHSGDRTGRRYIIQQYCVAKSE